ncbi:MAG: DUF494 family protein [Ignavibacteriales bacterium]|nr:DUF494 family protein [Ignavibacteriales bacterium]
MREKIITVITRIFEGMKENIPIEEVSKNLLNNKEFDDHLISAAFSLLYDKIVVQNLMSIKDKTGSTRIFSESEIDMLGRKNYDYLLHLQNIGLLNSVDIENILYGVSMVNKDTLTHEELNYIILYNLIGSHYNLIYGSRYFLDTTDKIN